MNIFTYLPSEYSPEELEKRWDEYTSPARFAGNDDTLDLIFSATRRGNRIKLVRRAGTTHEPYAAVFRGRIVADKNGSALKGVFTKSIADYVITAIIISIAAMMRVYAESRGSDLYTTNVLLALCIVGGMLLLMNYRRTKRKYVEFMSSVTGKDIGLYRSRREMKNDETNGD